MISLDRLEIPNLGFSRIFVIARIRYENRCELINILFNLHQSVHPLLGPYRSLGDAIDLERGSTFPLLRVLTGEPHERCMSG